MLGQALHAAHATVEGRQVHSLHAYFLRRGDFKAPIVYQVDRSRDGGSFSSRRVVAIQHGAQIFHMSASFHELEAGLEHQLPMPQVPPPESLLDLREILEAQARPLPDVVRRFAGRNSPFEFRSVQPVNFRIRIQASRASMCGFVPWMRWARIRAATLNCWPMYPTTT